MTQNVLFANEVKHYLSKDEKGQFNNSAELKTAFLF